MLFSSGTVVRNIANADQVTDTILLGTYPTTSGIGVNPNTNLVYVAANAYNTHDGPVMVIDGNTNAIVSKITVGSDTWGVGVNPNTNKIYVASHNLFTVYVIDGATKNVVSIIDVGDWPEDIAVNPNTNMIYVTNSGSGTVSVINGTTNSVVNTIPVGSYPDGVAVNPNTDMIYVVNSGPGTISVINGTTNSVVSTIPTGGGSLSVSVNPNTNMVYATNDNNNGEVSVINGTTNSIVNTISIGSYPQNIVVNPNTNKIYVIHSNTVAVIDGATNSVAGTIYVGVNPIAIGVNPNTDKVYVSNNEDQTISVVDGSTTTSDFAVSPSPYGANIPVGASKSFSVIASSFYGFNGTVYLSASAPSGFNASISPSTVTVPSGGYATSTMTINVTSSASPGQYYKVIVSGTNGTLTHSTYALIWPYAVPTPPQNLTATPVSSSQINLSWIAPANEGGFPLSGYEIERSDDGGSTWSTIVSNTYSTATTFSDTGLVHSTTHTYRVSAINYVGTSQPSNAASATTFNVVPSPPTNLTAIPNTLQIGLSWNAPSDNGGTPVTGYMIERSTDNGSTWSTLVADTGNTKTTYSDTNVLPLTTYTYRVSAINDIGTGNPSNTASATPLSVAPVTSPSLT